MYILHFFLDGDFDRGVGGGFGGGGGVGGGGTGFGGGVGGGNVHGLLIFLRKLCTIAIHDLLLMNG